MAKTVADQFADILVTVGVKRIYGIVGDSLNGLTDALRRQDKIDWIHVRHEEIAAFAAGAEAHLTGELAVCAGSCGPGNLHLINGLFDCHRSRVPVLAIAAHVPSGEIGSGYFQETHPESLFKECSHYCELVSAADTGDADLFTTPSKTLKGQRYRTRSCRFMTKQSSRANRMRLRSVPKSSYLPNDQRQRYLFSVRLNR